MGRQQSYLFAKEGQFDDMMRFITKNDEWFNKRYCYPICAVRLMRDFSYHGIDYPRNTFALVIGGDRGYQNMGIDSFGCLEFVQNIVYIENFAELCREDDSDIGTILDEWTQEIRNEDFYDKYKEKKQ